MDHILRVKGPWDDSNILLNITQMPTERELQRDCIDDFDAISLEKFHDMSKKELQSVVKIGKSTADFKRRCFTALSLLNATSNPITRELLTPQEVEEIRRINTENGHVPSTFKERALSFLEDAQNTGDAIDLVLEAVISGSVVYKDAIEIIRELMKMNPRFHPEEVDPEDEMMMYTLHSLIIDGYYKLVTWIIFQRVVLVNPRKLLMSLWDETGVELMSDVERESVRKAVKSFVANLGLSSNAALTVATFMCDVPLMEWALINGASIRKDTLLDFIEYYEDHKFEVGDDQYKTYQWLVSKGAPLPPAQELQTENFDVLRRIKR